MRGSPKFLEYLDRFSIHDVEKIEAILQVNNHLVSQSILRGGARTRRARFCLSVEKVYKHDILFHAHSRRCV